MDFYQIRTKELKAGTLELYPDFQVSDRSEDLMIRGGSFYAIWDEERKLWSQNPADVQRLVDEDLEREAKSSGVPYIVRTMKSYESGAW
jgi:hypothetical protein